MMDLHGKPLNRNYSLSLIRVISCLAIIVLHTANVSEMLYRDDISLYEQTCSMGTVYIMMWAVPCFLMTSGALILEPSRELPLKKLFKKYVPKALIPLVFFGIVFQIIDEVMDGNEISIDTLKRGIYEICTGKSWAHLWYLYLLLGIYLLLPFYRMIAKGSDEKMLRYLLIVYFVFLSIIQAVKSTGIPIAFNIQVSGIYIFYLFAGYAFSQKIIRINKVASFFIFFVSTAFIAILTYRSYYYEIETFDGILESYASPFVVLQSIGFFSFFYSDVGKETGDKLSLKILNFFDENSFGVYLIHMIFIRIVLRYHEVNLYEKGILGFVFYCLLLFVVTTVLTGILRIPLKFFRKVSAFIIQPQNQDNLKAKTFARTNISGK